MPEEADVAALEEYLVEWQTTCHQMDLPFTLKDAARFVLESGQFVPLSATREATERAERFAGEISEIKGSLSQVAVYEGMEGSPTALLVSELVRDHEELEARIDAALIAISTGPPSEMYQEVARLLRGGKRVPDDPGELDG